MSSLTPQERECLRLVAQQRSSKEIALVLGISKASVDTYCNRARAKLGVATRRDAALLAGRLEVASSAQQPATAEVMTPFPSGVGAAPATLVENIAGLGPLGRLGAILAGAVVLTIAFGVLVSALQSLDEVVATHGRGVSAAAAHARAG